MRRTAATAVPTAFVRLSVSLFKSKSTINGTKAAAHAMTPILFHSQNFSAFASDAGEMRFAFFQSCAPATTAIKSITRKMIPCTSGESFAKNGMTIFSVITHSASTSSAIAKSHSAAAPSRSGSALPDSPFAFGAVFTVLPVDADTILCFTAIDTPLIILISLSTDCPQALPYRMRLISLRRRAHSHPMRPKVRRAYRRRLRFS